MADFLIRRKHFAKEVVRKIECPRLDPAFVDGMVKGLRIAFDQQEYDIDTTEIEAMQGTVSRNRTGAVPVVTNADQRDKGPVRIG